MKTMKKILCAVLISLMTLFVVPVVMPLNDTVYTVEAASVKISKSKYTMNKGEKYTLKIKGTKKKVKWSTSNKKVATVSSKGKVTAKKNGTATITAKVGSKKYKCKITVKDPSISKSKIYIRKNETYTLKVKDTNQKIKWSTSNKKIATVDSKGKVKAKKNGTATITAKVGSKKLKCKVTVKEPSISKTKISVDIGQSYTLKVKDTSQSIKWSSSDKSIATVDSNGTVTAVKAGKVTISAKVGSKKLKCTVTVTKPDFSKYVAVSKTKLVNNEFMVTIKNIGKTRIDFLNYTVEFYRNGSKVGQNYNGIKTSFLPNETTYELIPSPYDKGLEKLKYDNIKVYVTDLNTYSESVYSDYKKNVKITSKESQDENIATSLEVTNTGKKEIESVCIGVIFYKNNNIIGYKNQYIFNFKAGNKEICDIYKLKDENYNDIEYDYFKVVLTDANTYNY